MSVSSPMTTEHTLKWYRWFAHLPVEKKRRVIEQLSDQEALILKYTWEAWARDKQLEPEGDWLCWLLQCGRGFGKSRTGAEWIRKQVETGQAKRIALVARTAGDVRDVIVEGNSGILAVSPPYFAPKYEPSKRRLTWPNGAVATTYSADEPDMLRGPEHDCAWADERASWKVVGTAEHGDAWSNLLLGLRIGKRPRCIVTTTPRPTKEIKALASASTTHVTRGTSYENKENLSPQFWQQVSKLEGTRLGRQEIEGLIIEDLDGALWKRSMIEDYRVTTLPEMSRVVVAIDPAVTAEEGSDETGIIVAGLGTDKHGYILEDRSLRASPNTWAAEAIAAHSKYKADRIIGEVNQGGDLIENTLRTIDRHISYKAVRATRGKQLRAEPVSSLYERGLVHHVGIFPELEDQLCNWVPGMGHSPDRLDALCYALTELMVGEGMTATDYISQLKHRVAIQQQKRGAA